MGSRHLETIPNLLDLIKRHGAMAEQVEQSLPLLGKAQPAGQQPDGRDVRPADGRHDPRHQDLMAGETSHNHSEANQVFIGEEFWCPIAHLRNLS